MAKKKKKKVAAAPAKPAPQKKPTGKPAAKAAPKAPPKAAPRKAAHRPAARRKKTPASLRVELALAHWWERLGLRDYTTREWGRLGILAIGLGVILLYAFSAGGYFVVRRGYGELILLWLIVVSMLFELKVRGRFPRIGYIELGIFGGYVLWAGLTVFWSLQPARSVDEFVRGLLYISGFGLGWMFLERRQWLGWVGHLFVVIVLIACIDGLIGKTFPDVISHPDPFRTNRLNYPLTYWNTMAIFVSMAFLIGIRTLADRATHLAVRCLYAAPMMVFLLVLWFTFSRAGMLMLGLAFCVYLYLAVTRLRAVMQAALLGFWTGIIVFICYRFLPNMVASVPDDNLKISEGHKLALVIVLFALLAVASQFVIRRLEDRVTVPAELGRRIGYAIAGATALLMVSAILAFTFSGGRGGPFTYVKNQLVASETERTTIGQAPTERLFSLQSERFQEYATSLKSMREHPLGGTGAGTWSIAWLQNRPWDIQVKNGHSWFFQSLAEEGLLGGLLVLAFIAAFFTASVRDIRFMGKGKQRELYGAMFVAASLVLLHSTIDWDWEMPVIMLSFFMFAGILLRFGQLARTGQDEAADAAEPPRGLKRTGIKRFLGMNWLIGAACLVAMVATLLPLIAATKIQTANSMAQRQDYANLEKEAQSAHSFSPWDAEPLVLQALAAQGLGRIDDAERLLSDSLEVEPQNDKTYRNLTRIYLQQYQNAQTRGDAAAMNDYLIKASRSVYEAYRLNPLESRETGDLTQQVKNIGGLKFD